jgi:hypothetical protein
MKSWRECCQEEGSQTERRRRAYNCRIKPHLDMSSFSRNDCKVWEVKIMILEQIQSTVTVNIAEGIHI